MDKPVEDRYYLRFIIKCNFENIRGASYCWKGAHPIRMSHLCRRAILICTFSLVGPLQVLSKQAEYLSSSLAASESREDCGMATPQPELHSGSAVRCSPITYSSILLVRSIKIQWMLTPALIHSQISSHRFGANECEW